MSEIKLYCGDCLEILGTLEENSVDTVITDPPGGISFMNKKWDSDRGGRNQWIAWLTSILEECYRVMKPGGALVVWSIPRTSHWTGTAVENAGFRIIDVIQHVFGSGFPKSANIGKQLDKAAGKEREVIGFGLHAAYRQSQPFGQGAIQDARIDTRAITAPATPAAKLWDGWGTALKPAAEFWWLAYKPRDGTYAHNALKWGVAGIWVDGGRIAVSQDDPNHRVPSDTQWGSSDATKNCYGKGLSGRPTENLTPSGRWPSNLLLSHSSDRECFCAGNWAECPYCNGTGIVEGCKKVGVRKVKGDKRDGSIRKVAKDGSPLARSWVNSSVQGIAIRGHADSEGYETIEEWDCVEGCPIKILGEQSGERAVSGTAKLGKPQTSHPENATIYGKYAAHTSFCPNDTGTAARFFLNLPGETRFFYCPKAPRSQRGFYCHVCESVFPMAEREGHGHDDHLVSHPTQKPQKLMEYLCRLTRTPTGGTVLDPFMGSGTTGLAAINTDRDFIGIELDPEYFEIAEQRIESERTKMKQLELSGI